MKELQLNEDNALELKLLNPQEPVHPSLDLANSSHTINIQERISYQDQHETSFFDIREKSFRNFTLHSMKEGIPTSFCYGDFFICALVCRMFLGARGEIDLIASTAYYSAFYSMLMQAFIFGTIEVQGIFGSQANGKQNYLKMNLYFRQSILTGIIFFFTVTCIPAYFIEVFFPILGVTPELGYHVKSLIWFSLPAMFVRVFNDNFKTFLQNQGKLKLVGFYSILNIIPFIGTAYYLIYIENLGAVGIGLSLLQFETLSFLCMLKIYNDKIPTKFKLDQIPVTRELPKYIKQAIKLTLVDWYAYIVWDFMNVIVGWIGNTYQLACYSLNYNILLVNFSLLYGVNIFTRTQFNYFIGLKNLKILREVFQKLKLQVMVNGALLILLDFTIIMGIIYLGNIESHQLKYYI